MAREDAWQAVTAQNPRGYKIYKLGKEDAAANIFDTASSWLLATSIIAPLCAAPFIYKTVADITYLAAIAGGFLLLSRMSAAVAKRSYKAAEIIEKELGPTGLEE